MKPSEIRLEGVDRIDEDILYSKIIEALTFLKVANSVTLEAIRRSYGTYQVTLDPQNYIRLKVKDEYVLVPGTGTRAYHRQGKNKHTMRKTTNPKSILCIESSMGEHYIFINWLTRNLSNFLILNVSNFEHYTQVGAKISVESAFEYFSHRYIAQGDILDLPMGLILETNIIEALTQNMGKI